MLFSLQLINYALFLSRTLTRPKPTILRQTGNGNREKKCVFLDHTHIHTQTHSVFLECFLVFEWSFATPTLSCHRTFRHRSDALCAVVRASSQIPSRRHFSIHEFQRRLSLGVGAVFCFELVDDLSPYGVPCVWEYINEANHVVVKRYYFFLDLRTQRL
jgi:hypothetical protein